MTITENEVASAFAAHNGKSIEDVTHCVWIGTRNGVNCYAVGWWTNGYFASAIVDFDGRRFGEMRLQFDADVERIGIE